VHTFTPASPPHGGKRFPKVRLRRLRGTRVAIVTSVKALVRGSWAYCPARRGRTTAAALLSLSRDRTVKVAMGRGRARIDQPVKPQLSMRTGAAHRFISSELRDARPPLPSPPTAKPHAYGLRFVDISFARGVCKDPARGRSLAIAPRKAKLSGNHRDLAGVSARRA
jgi:hypothetical protein